jgi:hypothetical protein
MDNSRSFQRLAGVTAILSAPLALASFVLPLMSMSYNFDAFSNLSLLLQAGAGGATLWRWGMILDMLGYYLLVAPLTLFLWRWLKPKDPDQVRLFTLCLLAYILIGAIGAAILATVFPPLMVAYTALPEQRATLEVVFTAFTNTVYSGLWGLLEVFIAGIGWIGIGLFLRRERPAIGVTTVILGILALVTSLGGVTGIEAHALSGLFPYLVLAPIWALWLGIDLLRKPVLIEST